MFDASRRRVLCRLMPAVVELMPLTQCSRGYFGAHKTSRRRMDERPDLPEGCSYFQYRSGLLCFRWVRKNRTVRRQAPDSCSKLEDPHSSLVVVSYLPLYLCPSGYIVKSYSKRHRRQSIDSQPISYPDKLNSIRHDISSLIL